VHTVAMLCALAHRDERPPVHYRRAAMSVPIADQTVLILSEDPVIGALLGAYVEFAGHRPFFADLGQAGDAATEQCDPAIILVDLDHRDGAGDSFMARQLAAGRGVIVFSSRRPSDEIQARAQRLGAASVEMPVEVADFARVLGRVVRDRAGQSKRPAP
jgi:DNA-binding response OmpR family regulator